jgi:hypothetical protein
MARFAEAIEAARVDVAAKSSAPSAAAQAVREDIHAKLT